VRAILTRGLPCPSGDEKFLPMRNLSPSLAVSVVGLMLLGACGRPAPAGARSLVLATTTSAQDSGILDSLVPLFERDSRIAVKVIAVGTSAALDLGARGEADAVLVHAPSTEAPYVARGDLNDGHLVMHNEFLVVGPAADPARAAAAGSLDSALRGIAAVGPFVSRGDGSGTEARELELWKAVGVTPEAVRGREQTGQGMGATLLVADAHGAYTLTDRGTYLAFRSRLRLVPLVQGDPRLRNIYHAYAVNPARHREVHAAEGRAFVRFLVSPGAQALIGRFGRERFGEPLVTPDARADSAAGPAISSGGDRGESRAIVLRTLMISGLATLAAMLVGVPLGYALARSRFPGRTLVVTAVNTGMGLPPVVVGLLVWLVLARNGVFGSWELIYTRQAMVIAQFIIATPVVIGVTSAAIQSLPPELPDLLLTLGAGRMRRVWLISREVRLGLLAAVMAAFGAVVSEVGASMIVGGNLQGDTRVLTTAIVTATGRGEIGAALGLGLVLLGLTFAVNAVLTVAQQRSA
jgi:ABC-type tungstate transport system permease subunit/ABC-type tungstate transport system substrate-binding protein